LRVNIFKKGKMIQKIKMTFHFIWNGGNSFPIWGVCFAFDLKNVFWCDINVKIIFVF